MEIISIKKKKKRNPNHLSEHCNLENIVPAFEKAPAPVCEQSRIHQQPLMYKRLKRVYMRAENAQILSKGFIHMLIVHVQSWPHLNCKRVLCRGGFKVEPKPKE